VIRPEGIGTDIKEGKLSDEMRALVLEGILMTRAGTAQDVADGLPIR